MTHWTDQEPLDMAAARSLLSLARIEAKAMKHALVQSVQHIDQLAGTANTISIHFGLGQKVNAKDYGTKARSALAASGAAK